MSTYAPILRVRGVPLLLVAATTVRLSPAINNLAILLYVDDVTGSFASAGAAGGAFALGTAIGAPLIGRLSDRRGLGVLAPFACAHLGALIGVWALGNGSAPVGVLVVGSLLAGSTYPPTGAALRARWPVLVGTPDLLPSAYALDSVAASVAFLTGPLITALLVVIVGPGLALPLAGGAALVATVAFVTRAPQVDGHDRAGGWLGALGGRGLRTLVMFIFAGGLSMGTVEVALAGFATSRGQDELAGVLLSLWSVATAVTSFAYGAHAWRLGLPLRTVNLGAAFALPVASIPIALAGSPLTMAILVVVSGLPFAPLLVSTNQLVGEVTPDGTETEAYSWIITAMVAGTALGAAAGGGLIEVGTWQAAIVSGAAIGLVGAIVLALRRGTLEPVLQPSVQIGPAS